MNSHRLPLLAHAKPPTTQANPDHPDSQVITGLASTLAISIRTVFNRHSRELIINRPSPIDDGRGTDRDPRRNSEQTPGSTQATRVSWCSLGHWLPVIPTDFPSLHPWGCDRAFPALHSVYSRAARLGWCRVASSVGYSRREYGVRTGCDLHLRWIVSSGDRS